MTEKELKTSITFITVPEIRKYLGMNLMKNMKDIYTKNYTY